MLKNYLNNNYAEDSHKDFDVNQFTFSLLVIIVFFSLIYPSLASAGGQTGGGLRNEVNTVNNSNSGAYAGNTGNRQNINFNSPGTPATQTINTTPSLGGLYMMSTAPCEIGTGAGVGVTGVSAQVSGGVLSRPCHLANQVTINANTAIASYSLGMKTRAKQNMRVATELAKCGEVTDYITAKALGYDCAVIPDRDLLDVYMGGMVRAIVKPNPGYKPVEYEDEIDAFQTQQTINPDYVTRPELNQKLDNAQRLGAMK